VIGLIISYVAYALFVLVLIRALMSWIPGLDPRNPLVNFVIEITEPILAPIRSLMPRTMIDFSPMIASFILIFIAQAAAGAG
jgi:YggT family protein